MEGGQQATNDACPQPQAPGAVAAPPAARGMRHRAVQAWDSVNEALAEDWQFNVEFDRCAHARQDRAGGEPCRSALLHPLLRAAALPLPCGSAPSGPPPCLPGRYFWRTTLALYAVFTAKTAPQLSRRENLENCIICAAIVGMAAVST